MKEIENIIKFKALIKFINNDYDNRKNKTKELFNFMEIDKEKLDYYEIKKIFKKNKWMFGNEGLKYEIDFDPTLDIPKFDKNLFNQYIK
jgi:hypothetical protein